MNEQMKALIDSIGALSEYWIITYQNFIQHGISKEEALMHTREFTKALMESMKG